jgi:type II secretory pathway pseudopilin PulG
MRSGRQGGFFYIGLLIALAIIGIGLGAVSEAWSLALQRERERELLFIGNQFRQAITRYYLESPAANRKFPSQLDDLLEDARNNTKVQHYLRKMYPDPMTRSANWGEIRLAGGQLVGVYSQSNDTPLKTSGFAWRDKQFAGKERYSEWEFRSALPAANPVLQPNGSYITPGAAGPVPNNNPVREPRPQIATPLGVILPMPRSR